MLRRPIAIGLALCHGVLLSGTTSLHTHGPETAGLDLADLPAQYHSHDFRFAPGVEDPAEGHDECVGCRLERTPGMPLPAAAGLVGGSTAAVPATVPAAAPSTARLDDLLPRAPPRA